MKSSIEIYNELHELDGLISKATDDFNAADGDVKDIHRDAINKYQGRKDALNDMLGDVLKAEDDIRRGGGIPLMNSGAEDEFKARTLAERFLGDPKAFKGVNVGDKMVVDAYTDLGLTEYEEVDRNLPRQSLEGLPYFGVYSTLPKATTKADVLTFFEADEEKYVNNAATWTPGTVKPTSSMAWKQRSAHMELIANGMPVLETDLKDWGNLRQIIDVELMFMQERVKAAKTLVGPKANAESGIVGILEHDGILKYAKKSAKEGIADSAYRMRTDVFLASGIIPTVMAVHPYVSESVVLEKDANGRYINQMVNGNLWAMRVVDDLGLTSVDAEASKYGMLVYWPQAATFYTREGETIEVGTINDQFMRNEKTVRIEGRYGLKVGHPKGFSYMADTGVTR